MKWRLFLGTVAVVAVCGLGALAGLDYVHRQEALRKDREAARKLVSVDTVSSKAILEYELSPSGVTFKELFEQIDDRLKKLTDDRTAVAASSLPKAEREAVDQYLSDIQATLRADENANRKSLAVDGAIETLKREVEEARTANYLVYDVYKRSADKASNDAKDALKESQSAATSFQSQVKALSKSLAPPKNELKGYQLLDPLFLDKLLPAKKQGA